MERVPPGPASCRFAIVALLLLISATTSPAELGAILENTAVEPPARVSFREERHNPIFKEPMVLTGHLEYMESGVLRKTIDTPFAEDILVEADHVIVWRDDKAQKLPLNRSRALQVILGAIEAVLAGDQERLEASFRCELSGGEDAWTLQMTPLSRSVEKRVSALEITGNSRAVTSIRVDLRDDEWHLMSIGDTQDDSHEEP